MSLQCGHVKLCLFQFYKLLKDIECILNMRENPMHLMSHVDDSADRGQDPGIGTQIAFLLLFLTSPSLSCAPSTAFQAHLSFRAAHCCEDGLPWRQQSHKSYRKCDTSGT